MGKEPRAWGWPEEEKSARRGISGTQPQTSLSVTGSAEDNAAFGWCLCELISFCDGLGCVCGYVLWWAWCVCVCVLICLFDGLGVCVCTLIQFYDGLGVCVWICFCDGFGGCVCVWICFYDGLGVCEC